MRYFNQLPQQGLLLRKNHMFMYIIMDLHTDLQTLQLSWTDRFTGIRGHRFNLTSLRNPSVAFAPSTGSVHIKYQEKFSLSSYRVLVPRGR